MLRAVRPMRRSAAARAVSGLLESCTLSCYYLDSELSIMALRVMAPLLSLCACAASPPLPLAPASPPCYTPLNPALETLCFSTQATSGNVSVRVVGAGVDGVLLTGMSANTTFAGGSVASATPVFEYFLSDNDEFTKVPLTVPLIFRPDAAGTWLASFALPTSVYASASKAPGIVPGMDARFEEFAPGAGGRTLAAWTFYTIQVATAADYAAACAQLADALPGMGLAPVDGAWRQAWVAYSPQAMVRAWAGAGGRFFWFLFHASFSLPLLNSFFLPPVNPPRWATWSTSAGLRLRQLLLDRARQGRRSGGRRGGCRRGAFNVGPSTRMRAKCLSTRGRVS